MIKSLIKIITFPFRKVAVSAAKTHLSPEANRKRIAKNILFLAILVFTVFIVRFSWITVTDSINGVKLSSLAKANYSETTTVYAKRGTIFDREGVPIATDSSDYSIYVILDKKYVSADGKKLYSSAKDFEKIAKLFKEKLELDTDYTLSQLKRKGASQVEFGTKGKHISFTKKEEIEKEAKANGIQGIGFTSHLSRSYVANSGNFASNFIGLAGLKDGDDDTKGLVGQFGLEASLDGVLSGTNGIETLEKNKNGQSLEGIAKSIKPAKDGQDVYTTLDSNLQTYLETLMDEPLKKSGAKELVATLVKADTGEILATTQRPTFNGATQKVIGPKDDKLSDKQNLNTQSNLLYQANYEPGSTFKLFTMAAAIENGTFDPNATYSSYTIHVGGTPISDWDIDSTAPNGLNLTYAQGFSHSSNVGMSKLQMAMGDKLWDDYLNRFQIGRRTLMGLGGESQGSLPDDNIVSQVNSSFGQGVSVTEVQMLRGFSAIANGGTMLEPHFISKVVDTNAKTQRKVQPEIVGKPVGEKTADSVLKYMVSVGTDSVNGTAYDWGTSQPYFRVGDKEVSIKTGTAQVAKDTGGYYVGDTAYLYSAVAMVPATNPDYIFYMTVKLPEHWDLGFISSVANPLLERAYELKATIDETSQKTIDNSENETQIALKNYEGKKSESTANLLRQQLLQPVIIGDGEIVTKQSISSGTKLGANKRILLLTNGKITMPDLYDWSKKDVETFAKWAGLHVTFDGKETGKVTKQSIKMNKALKKGKKLTVTLK